MNVNFNEFKNICSKFLERDRMLNEIPSAFREGFWNNPYDDLASTLLDILSSKALGKDLADWLSWYIYDRPDGLVTVDIENNNYRIETDDDFYNMIEKEYFND